MTPAQKPTPRGVTSLDGARILTFPAPARKACIDPSARGLVPLYEAGMPCPACRRRAWLVGRLSAECGFCGTALDLAGSRGRG